ncbi:MAG TPA: lanthionine synthetase LanC family protein, partial [Steroidobacteraceae bacterium]|nr:lanthionine synthetase LanC family protein [Steroidobacteraceae bacterium]
DLLLGRVLPCLAQHRAAFKLAADRDKIVQLSSGNFGDTQIGKVITVYPRSDTQAVTLALELIERTHGIDGPRIATDLHLGAAVYARYGAFLPRIVHDRFGEPEELIPDGSGNWVPDLRAVPFRCPAGITNPFPAALPAAAPPRARSLLQGRYFVTDVLRPTLAGSILRAIDVGDARGPRLCVLKQARPHCFEDALGRDYRARLRHERRVLARLRGLRGIVCAGEYFEEDAFGYLPLSYVAGRTLGELGYRHVSGRPWLALRAEVRHRLLRYADELVRRLRCAHARGVIHRDVSPGNVWIGDDAQLYLLDWESAHLVGSRSPPFRLGTPGFSHRSWERRAPAPSDDWHACGRVIAFLLTGLDPSAIIQGRPRELATRLAELTGLRGTSLIERLSCALADEPSGELDARRLRAALADLALRRPAIRQRAGAPLYPPRRHESVLAEALQVLQVRLRARLGALQRRHASREATLLDAHSGIAGLLYVLGMAQRAQLARLDGKLGEAAVRILMADTPVTPDLPGLVHGRAGRALAVASVLEAGCAGGTEALPTQMSRALAGRMDWPDLTHGAAGQGLAAMACAERLGMPELAAPAAECAAYLIRTQNPQGAWELPQGAPGASGQRYTGFAHGAAGIMGFLGVYAARASDPEADAAWRRAEAWLIRCARRRRGGHWQWPHSDSNPASTGWWCHGAPGIALGWLRVAQAQGTSAVAEEHLRGALGSIPSKLRTECLGQCHGLAGIGEVCLEAQRVLGEDAWRARADEIAQLLIALFRARSPQPWHYLRAEPDSGADGLMLGMAGIVHFLLRHFYPAAAASAPLLA